MFFVLQLYKLVNYKLVNYKLVNLSTRQLVNLK